MFKIKQRDSFHVRHGTGIGHCCGNWKLEPILFVPWMACGYLLVPAVATTTT
jgi:hypothetical protein